MGRSLRRRPSLEFALALAFGLALAACKHDLDALSAKSGDVRNESGKGGAGGNGSGGSGSGGSGGTAGKRDAGTPDMPHDAGPECGPCDPLSAGAKTIGLRSCCRGATGDECGLTFADGTLCLPRAVPGQTNDVCTEVELSLRVGPTMTLDGCCRPDAHCGVSAEGLGLGCVSRDQVPGPTGESLDPIACEYTCTDDVDCNADLPGNACTESPDHMRRLCAQLCKRDQDCGRGEICGFSNDNGKDRVLAVCRPPLGTVAPGEFCSAATDCIQGICSKSDNVCTKLCANDGDCGTGFSGCTMAVIKSPVTETPQNFKTCKPQ